MWGVVNAGGRGLVLGAWPLGELLAAVHRPPGSCSCLHCQQRDRASRAPSLAAAWPGPLCQPPLPLLVSAPGAGTGKGRVPRYFGSWLPFPCAPKAKMGGKPSSLSSRACLPPCELCYQKTEKGSASSGLAGAIAQRGGLLAMHATGLNSIPGLLDQGSP